ncbi:MAG: cytochrome b/b6 domain-containing protein [Gammaproteobacteria bacterium]
METAYYSRPTRFLHFGLALTVTFQLAISLVMQARAHQGVPPGAFAHGAFEAHRFVGLAAVAIVVLHWLWSLRPHMDGGIGHLFPWAGADRARVMTDVRGLLRGRVPDSGPRGGLAGAIHGLGLLAVTAMAVSGTVLFVAFPEAGPVPAAAHNAAEVHSAIANLVWAYWFGHVGMALLHHLTGHDTLRRIFSLGGG